MYLLIEYYGVAFTKYTSTFGNPGRATVTKIIYFLRLYHARSNFVSLFAEISSSLGRKRVAYVHKPTQPNAPRETGELSELIYSNSIGWWSMRICKAEGTTHNSNKANGISCNYQITKHNGTYFAAGLLSKL